MGKLLLISCTSVGREIIKFIEEKGVDDVELVGVVDMSPESAINKANYDSYIDLFNIYNIPYYYCKNVNEEGCLNFIKALEPDIILQSGWSQKFSDELLMLPKHACIGEHPAPLPKGRGAACVNWAIITGEKNWGDSFFKMEKQYDTGLIYDQKFFNIEEYDDVKSIYDKVALCAVNIVKENMTNWVNGRLEGVQQDNTKSSHYGKRIPENGLFDFTQNSFDIYNQIRGQAKPYPGAFYIDKVNGEDKKIYVWKSSLFCEEKNDGGINIECGDGKTIRLLRVQVEGYPEMWAKDAFNLFGFNK